MSLINRHTTEASSSSDLAGGRAMKTFERKLRWCALVTYLTAPTIAYSAPGQLADQPLWLGSSVKHNLMFAIDDSGSMDWELSFPVNDGTPRLRSDGNFVDSNGDYLNSGGYGQYAYVFANGVDTGGYDGRRLYSNRYAIPPIAQYASAKSSAYNTAYYDPSVTYDPWPTFTNAEFDSVAKTNGYTFTDASVTATLVEPVTTAFGTRTVNLFADLDTSTKTESYWDYDIRDADMVCKESGADDCADNSRQDYTFYPATYYLKDQSDHYYYHAAGGSGSGAPSKTDSDLLEAENTDGISQPMRFAADLETLSSGTESDRIQASRDTNVTSGGDFIGTLVSLGTSKRNSVPTTGIASYRVEAKSSGTHYIWMRVFGAGGASDSFWAKLTEPSGSDPSVSYSNGNALGDYGSLQNNMPNNTWGWVKWGEANLTAGTYQLDVAYREGGTLMDQILVTSNTDTPTGIMTFEKGDRRECSASTPSDYLEFARNPERYRIGESSGSDSLIESGRSLAFDGACLTRYQIGKTQADGEAFINGAGVTRTVLEEKQNFANWFQYYRRRHQAMRGGLAAAVQGINGIKTGMFWINNRRTVGSAQMKDVGVGTELGTFLDEHYTRVNAGGTPLRSALNHARNQFKSTTGPITSECQKNYTLLFTDGFNTQNTTSEVQSVLNDGIGNQDGSAGAPYQDSYSTTLGDIAYDAYTTNLRGDLPTGAVRVNPLCADASPDAWLDCNTNLHMNTYTVGLGLRGNIFGVTHHAVEDAHGANTEPVWPDASISGLPQVDDLYHAAVNGHGEMYSATSPDSLKESLRSAINDIVASIGSGSGVTFNSSSLRAQDGTSIYTTLFNSSDWSGDLEARLLDPSNGDVLDIVWSNSAGNASGAAALLDERDISVADQERVIYTQGASDGVTFEWANLTDAQKNDLRTNPPGEAASPDDTLAQDRLAYLRGDRSKEGGAFRARGSRMADVIHSAPVYVGEPSSAWPDDGLFGVDGNRYSDFSDKDDANGGAAGRTPVVYVGANGGMLHGFNGLNSGTDAGKEVMAYVPNLVYSSVAGEGLHYLTDPNYAHQYYVDLTPVAQDVYTKGNSADVSRDWRTVLVGGLRAGGKGLFALDVTNPDDFTDSATNAANIVMWEFTESDDANLGFLTTAPLISLMNNGKWAVIFGNGYESTNGRAALMILYIEEGLDGWAATDKVVIDTGVGTSLDKNGLSGVTAVDLNGDQIPDRIYGGDIKGNMWAFDVSNTNAANWGSAYNSGTTPKPLFSAKDSNGTAQPITAAPSLALNSAQANKGFSPNALVTFGTGQYLVDGDQANVDVQSYYTIWDSGTEQELVRTDLAARTFTETDEVKSLTGTDVNWDNDEGWYVDFIVTGESAEGERVTQKPELLFDSEVGPIALFSSLVPDVSECSGGGASYLYALPLLTGLNPSKPILDLNDDGFIDENDVGAGMKSDNFNNETNVLGKYTFSSNKERPKDSTGIEKGEHAATTTSDREGRLGWFELINQ